MELQDLQNRTEADKADTEYMTSVAQMRGVQCVAGR